MIASATSPLLKHASGVTGSVLEIDRLFADAGAPEGLFRTLVVPSARVAGILEHPLVRADEPGAWYAATVLAGVEPGMAVYDEETFGPVAAVISASDEHECIRIANDTEFGLGVAIFTADVERGERIDAEDIDAGSCFVNAFVASDPRLPFGGIKASGYGRELADLGIKEFVNIKTVVVD